MLLQKANQINMHCFGVGKLQMKRSNKETVKEGMLLLLDPVVAYYR